MVEYITTENTLQERIQGVLTMSSQVDGWRRRKTIIIIIICAFSKFINFNSLPQHGILGLVGKKQASQ